MLTVRYPSGVSVQYNAANYVEYLPVVARLFTKEGGAWIADVVLSGGPIIENGAPCAVRLAGRRGRGGDA